MIPFHERIHNKPVNFLTLLVICIEIITLSFLFQRDVVTFQAHYFFVFVIGNLLIGSYLFYSNTPKQAHYIPIHIFLWVFLLYSHHALLFYIASGLFIAASIFYVFNISLHSIVRLVYCLLALCTMLAAVFIDPAILFLLCSSYMVMMVLYSPSMSKMLKWNIAIVSMLHLFAILASTEALMFPYQQNTIFTLPVSFLLFVCIVLKYNVKRSLFSLIFVPSISFAFVVAVLFGYSLASYQLVYSDRDMFSLYWGLSIGSGVLIFTLCYYIHYFVSSKLEQVHNQLDAWFVNKWEDAISQYEKNISWSGFDSKLAELVPNDGIKLVYKEQTVFSSGCFIDDSFSAGKQLYAGGEVRLYIHETNTHRSHSAASFYMFYALMQYIEQKQSQWQEISKLKMSFAEPSGDFGKDLKFRQEVTYYLHDNILQNIIATKNIVASLTTEQAALKELAVDTLTELNSSIRSQMHDIYPSTLADLSFERNIHILMDEMRKRYGYIPTPHITYELAERMDDQTAYLFYRTLQELLANTCKYAQADNIWIQLYEDDAWILEVREDGIPIKIEDMEIKIKHLGISSLKQQANALHGAFEMKQDKQGKQFKLTVPKEKL